MAPTEQSNAADKQLRTNSSDALHSQVGVVTDLDTSAVRQTFAEGQTLVAEFSSPGAAGEDCSLMLSFDTDANNYRNFSGFDVSYVRRADISPTNRGDAAAATGIFRGDKVAATPRPRRG